LQLSLHHQMLSDTSASGSALGSSSSADHQARRHMGYEREHIDP